MIIWGGRESGGNTSEVVDELVNVERIVGNRNAFAAITTAGKVISWGISGINYIDVADQLASDVVDVIPSDQAFAAIKANGSVVTWGSYLYGANSSAVSVELASGVVDITASKHSFAALKSNGSVVVWGGDQAGDSSAVQGQLQSGVEKIYANDGAFAALKTHGSIVAWGNDESGASTRFAMGGALGGIVNLADVFTDELIGKDFADTNTGTKIDSINDFLEGELIQRVEISSSDVLTSEKKKVNL